MPFKWILRAIENLTRAFLIEKVMHCNRTKKKEKSGGFLFRRDVQKFSGIDANSRNTNSSTPESN
jgi:hypothetical protein